mmetsp:Transcript_527/g.1804  ORF Transcript_527/g.1804 Transcript_527/m.1804 type:complete len:153 (+) Transcript_527:355-813(+)
MSCTEILPVNGGEDRDLNRKRDGTSDSQDEGRDDPWIDASSQLAWEIARQRLLELELEVSKNRMQQILWRGRGTRTEQRTIHGLVPVDYCAGLPLGARVQISAGEMVLSPLGDGIMLTLRLDAFNFREDEAVRIITLSSPENITSDCTRECR